MTLVAEAPPARVTASTAVECDLSPVTVTHELLSNLLQEIHVVKPHVFRVPDTFPVFFIGQFEERVGSLNQYRRGGAVRNGKQDDEGRNRHNNGISVSCPNSLNTHICSPLHDI